MALTAALAVLAAVAVAAYSAGFFPWSSHRDRFTLPPTTASYVGLYQRGVPESYAGISAFATAAGIKPGVVMYYSAWQTPFQTGFAQTVASHGAVPIVQINPTGTNIAAIAAGKFDGYLTTYAQAVRAYHRPVIMSFGHEMNGYWYTWANTHTSPQVFVAAWRHLVTVFRAVGVPNVTWMWTVNAIQDPSGVVSPGPWWPGRSYVNWVGIDGYYSSPSVTFASLFGPTVAAVRELTGDPILVAETSATPAAGQPAKIADLFAGIRLYDLLGLVWFNVENWRLSGPAAVAAFRRGARSYHRPAP